VQQNSSSNQQLLQQWGEGVLIRVGVGTVDHSGASF